MKTLAALALVLAACASNDAPNTPSALDVRDSKFGIAGTFQENGTAINFHFSHGDIEITTLDGFRILDSHRGDARLLETYPLVGTRFSSEAMHDLAALPELAVIRDLPGALHERGIEINSFVAESPALVPILCPTLHTDAVDATLAGDAN